MRIREILKTYQNHIIQTLLFGLSISSLILMSYSENILTQTTVVQLLNSPLSILVFICIIAQVCFVALWLKKVRHELLLPVLFLKMYNLILIFTILSHPEYANSNSLQIGGWYWIALIAFFLELYLIYKSLMAAKVVISDKLN